MKNPTYVFKYAKFIRNADGSHDFEILPNWQEGCYQLGIRVPDELADETLYDEPSKAKTPKERYDATLEWAEYLKKDAMKNGTWKE